MRIARRARATTNRLIAEALGTAFLLLDVVGSGVRLSDDLTGLALLANGTTTGAVLYVGITIFGPISGAHFNPAVTLAFTLRRVLPVKEALAFVAVQILVGIAGAWLAHILF